MRSSPETPPFVVALSRLLDLRAAYVAASGLETRGVVSDSDLLALAYLAAELGVRELVVTNEPLLEALRAAGLESYVEAHSGHALTLTAQAAKDRTDRPGRRAVCREVSSATSEGPPVPVLFLCGLGRTVDASVVAAAAAQVEGGGVLLPLAGTGVALWRANGMLVVSPALADAARGALERLAVLVRDPSLDPLALFDSCVQLRLDLKARGEEVFVRLSDRVVELEGQVAALRSHLQKQQRALALLGAGGKEGRER